MTDRTLQFSGHSFSTEALHPFGERWIPLGERVDIDALIAHDIDAIALAVAQRALVVILDTDISYKWGRVLTEQTTQVPHVDTSLSGNILVHILHSDGKRNPTSYTSNHYLSKAARKNLPLLDEVLRNCPAPLIIRYSLNTLHKEYSSDVEQFYSMTPMLNPLQMMENDIRELEGIVNSTVWRADCNEQRARSELHTLYPVYFALRDFYLRIAADSEKYTHEWQKYPHSTVFAYQDTSRLFGLPGSDSMTYHMRTPSAPMAETGLYRNYITRSSGRLNLAFDQDPRLSATLELGTGIS